MCDSGTELSHGSSLMIRKRMRESGGQGGAERIDILHSALRRNEILPILNRQSCSKVVVIGKVARYWQNWRQLLLQHPGGIDQSSFYGVACNVVLKYLMWVLM